MNNSGLRLDALAGDRVQDLEALNVALALEDPRDFHLEARRRHVHAALTGNRGIPDARQHVCNRVCHLS